MDSPKIKHGSDVRSSSDVIVSCSVYPYVLKPEGKAEGCICEGSVGFRSDSRDNNAISAPNRLRDASSKTSSLSSFRVLSAFPSIETFLRTACICAWGRGSNDSCNFRQGKGSYRAWWFLEIMGSKQLIRCQLYTCRFDTYCKNVSFIYGLVFIMYL